MFKKNKKQKIGGYTIIETMIAVSIFLIVVTIGMGALLNSNSIHQKSQDTRAIMDNLSFIMEEMSKNLRLGYDYSPNGETQQITFTPPVVNNDGGTPKWSYKIESGNVLKSTDPSKNDSWVQLNSFDSFNKSGVRINESLSGFIVSGTSPIDTVQPFVIIKLVGTISSRGTTTPFNLQTSVSQRLIDLPVIAP